VAIPAPHTATQTKWVIAHHQLAHAGLLPALLNKVAALLERTTSC